MLILWITFRCDISINRELWNIQMIITDFMMKFLLCTVHKWRMESPAHCKWNGFSFIFLDPVAERFQFRFSAGSNQLTRTVIVDRINPYKLLTDFFHCFVVKLQYRCHSCWIFLCCIIHCLGSAANKRKTIFLRKSSCKGQCSDLSQRKSCNCVCVNSCFFQSSCGYKIHTVNARLCINGLGKFLNRRCKALFRGVFPYLVSCFKYLGSCLGALTEIFSHSGILCALSCK